MPIEIKITGDTPRAALVDLATYGLYCLTNDEIRAAATRRMEDTLNKADKAPVAAQPPAYAPPAAPVQAPMPAAPVAVYTPAPTPVAPPVAAPAPVAAQPPVAAPFAPAGMPATTPTTGPSSMPPITSHSNPAPMQAPTAPAPSFGLDQIGTAGADMIRDNPAKMPELLALLQQFGVPAITELKAEHLGAFATALRGLGAKI